MIKWFEEDQDLKEVGGKALNLSEIQKFTNVPPGFTITSRGFDSFLRENNLTEGINQNIQTLIEEKENCEKTSEKIKEKIINKKIPKKLEKEINDNYEGLKDKLSLENSKKFKVAVRSSSIDEDNPKASFAGQHDTYLNVKKRKIIESVKKCFASLYNRRALHYRVQKNILRPKIKMAVIIQEMIESKTSGVIFTRNPITKVNNQILIEAVSGSGESLVQGEESPNFYRIDKNSEEIIEKNLKENRNSKNQITKEQLKKLIRQSKKIEKHFEEPQDIEWVIDKKGKLWITQTRPETSDNNSSAR